MKVLRISIFFSNNKSLQQSETFFQRLKRCSFITFLLSNAKFIKRHEHCYLVCCCALLFIEPHASELRENRTDAEVGR